MNDPDWFPPGEPVKVVSIFLIINRNRGNCTKSLNESLNPSTRSGKLIFHILGALAEFERNLIRERTRAGLAAARRRGKRIGRPRKITGSATFELERRLDRGDPLREVARAMGVSETTITRATRRLSKSPRV